MAEIPPPAGARVSQSEGDSTSTAPGPELGPITLGNNKYPPINQLVGPSGEEQLLIAMHRLRDSGALRRLTPNQLLHVTELMPNSAGVQDANRIVQQQLGISLDEYLARYLPH